MEIQRYYMNYLHCINNPHNRAMILGGVCSVVTYAVLHFYNPELRYTLESLILPGFAGLAAGAISLIPRTRTSGNSSTDEQDGILFLPQPTRIDPDYDSSVNDDDIVYQNWEGIDEIDST